MEKDGESHIAFKHVLQAATFGNCVQVINTDMLSTISRASFMHESMVNDTIVPERWFPFPVISMILSIQAHVANLSCRPGLSSNLSVVYFTAGGSI
jgi:hypothetical protein